MLSQLIAATAVVSCHYTSQAEAVSTYCCGKLHRTSQVLSCIAVASCNSKSEVKAVASHSCGTLSPL
jgi:hypothetical protein